MDFDSTKGLLILLVVVAGVIGLIREKLLGSRLAREKMKRQADRDYDKDELDSTISSNRAQRQADLESDKAERKKQDEFFANRIAIIADQHRYEVATLKSHYEHRVEMLREQYDAFLSNLKEQIGEIKQEYIRRLDDATA